MKQGEPQAMTEDHLDDLIDLLEADFSDADDADDRAAAEDFLRFRD